MTEKIIINANNAPLGRIASYAAKQALLGRLIVVVNCNDALVSGRNENIMKEYRIARSRGGSSLNGPHFPKSPERLMKRAIRGMLSYKEGRGNTAFKNILCYNSTPSEYKDMKMISLQKEFNIKTLKLKEVSDLI